MFVVNQSRKPYDIRRPSSRQHFCVIYRMGVGRSLDCFPRARIPLYVFLVCQLSSNPLHYKVQEHENHALKLGSLRCATSSAGTTRHAKTVKKNENETALTHFNHTGTVGSLYSFQDFGNIDRPTGIQIPRAARTRARAPRASSLGIPNSRWRLAE